MESGCTHLMFDFAKRIGKLQRSLRKWGCDALILSALEGFDANCFYYSGEETFPALLVLTRASSTIFSLEPEAHENVFGSSLPIKGAREKISEILKKEKVKRLGVDDVSHSAGAALRARKKLKTELVPVGAELSRLRLLKDGRELACIRKSCSIALKCVAGFEDGGFAGKTEHEVAGEMGLEKAGFAGRTEHEIAGWMELRARKNGAALDAFPPMVLSGGRSAFFHNATSSKKISSREPVLIDWGCRVGNYCSDYTRTYANGTLDQQFLDAFEAVEESFKAVMKAAKPGVGGEKLEKIALDVIKQHGFEKYSHAATGLSLGHFVGLDVHDGGSLGKEKLRRGMAFTIEPGIYIPKKFGIRIENTVVLGY